ncbi:proline-rich protein 2-like [Ctenocephalides felis]|uniref:proline-rich protein 2-like n=1 Tax=Ctenocephalides felis TaxID=7515 RepID=UPI000E6E1695|nr:proline-rich protein 2-like [Ctenocephalides felis]
MNTQNDSPVWTPPPDVSGYGEGVRTVPSSVRLPHQVPPQLQNQNFVPRVPQQQGAPRPLQTRPPGPPGPPGAGPQPHPYQNSSPLPFQPRGPGPQQQQFNPNQQPNQQQYHPQLPQQQFQQQRPPPPRAVGYVATRPLFRQPQPGQPGSPIPGAQQQQPLRRPPPAHFNAGGSSHQQPQSPTRGGFYQFSPTQGSQPSSPVQQFSRSMERSPMSESPVANAPASAVRTDDEEVMPNQKPIAESPLPGQEYKLPESTNKTPEVPTKTPEPLESTKTPEPPTKTPEPGSKPPTKPATLSNETVRPDSAAGHATNGMPNAKSSTSRPASSKPQSGKKVVTPTDVDDDSGVDESTQRKDVNGAMGSPVKSPTSASGNSRPQSATPFSKPASSRSSAKPRASLKTPDTPPPTAEKKKVPMNKVQVGSAPSPNLKTVRSKIGSLDNASYKPGGGNVKIENRKIEFKATPRIAAKNETYVPGGGDKKITQTKLQWSARSKIGSLENASHKPGGGDKKIGTQKLDFKEKAKPKIASKDNIKHAPGGGEVKS